MCVCVCVCIVEQTYTQIYTHIVQCSTILSISPLHSALMSWGVEGQWCFHLDQHCSLIIAVMSSVTLQDANQTEDELMLGPPSINEHPGKRVQP